MSERDDGSDSDAPEEFTSLQGIEQDEEIRKLQRESNARVVRQGKEHRRKWAEKLTPRPSRHDGAVVDMVDTEVEQKSAGGLGMLPENIVQMLAAREKKVFSSDSDEEKHEKRPTARKRKQKKSGPPAVILNELPPPQCLGNSLEFLKKRRMQISRSSAVLNNSNQALRLLSKSGLISNK